MTLTQEQIEKLLWGLSKIGLDNAKKLTKDVNNIMDYMKILDEVDTSNVEPTTNVMQQKKTLREDILQEKNISPKELLDCSGQKVISNQIAISNIMH